MYIQRVIIIFFIGFLMFGSPTQGECSDWKLFYHSDEKGLKYFFDKESLVHSQTDIVQVWFKSDVIKDGSDEEEQYRAHFEINCKSKTYKILEESTSESAKSEERSQQTSTSQTPRRFSFDSALGYLRANVCPNR